MLKRRTTLMTWCGSLGFLLLAAVAGAGQLTSTRLMYLTFGVPVALPGRTLPAGTYAFELAVPTINAEIVRVSSKGPLRKLYFMGFTRSVERPADLPKDNLVSFGEAPRGEARPIAVWYPAGESTGRQFIYDKVR